MSKPSQCPVAMPQRRAFSIARQRRAAPLQQTNPRSQPQGASVVFRPIPKRVHQGNSRSGGNRTRVMLGPEPSALPLGDAPFLTFQPHLQARPRHAQDASDLAPGQTRGVQLLGPPHEGCEGRGIEQLDLTHGWGGWTRTTNMRFQRPPVCHWPTPQCLPYCTPNQSR